MGGTSQQRMLRRKAGRADHEARDDERRCPGKGIFQAFGNRVGWELSGYADIVIFIQSKKGYS